MLRALVAREHVLLVGPPGCAKSLLLEAAMRWLGGRTFTSSGRVMLESPSTNADQRSPGGSQRWAETRLAELIEHILGA